LINGDFELVRNSKFIGWESNGNYSIANNIFASNNSTILAFFSNSGEDMNIKQSIFMNRTRIYPLRIGGISKVFTLLLWNFFFKQLKPVNVSGILDANYAIGLEIIYSDNSKEKITIPFNTSANDFEVRVSEISIQIINRK
jgi:hypothetical protein